jgi:hypothetical protein
MHQTIRRYGKTKTATWLQPIIDRIAAWLLPQVALQKVPVRVQC